MSGDPYIKENDELRAEIARLRSDLAVEKINNKRLQSERYNAEDEIARLLTEQERLKYEYDVLQAALANKD